MANHDPMANHRICNGHKRDGSPCRQWAMRGKSKCHKCGGKSLSGVAHPNYKHGRYVKSLPTQLAQRAEEARNNPRLLSLTEEIALVEARLAQLLGSLGTGESGATWRALREALEAFSRAMGSGDMAGMDTHFTTMRDLVTRGSADAEAWVEIERLLDTRRRLAQAEVKTLQGLQQLVTMQQLTHFLGAMTNAAVQAVQRHADSASGRKILQELEVEFTRLATLEER